MTSDGTALHAAILANPACDTARLVYADYLQENGQPERAEFIRVQVELAAMGDPPKRPPAKPGPLNRTFTGWKRHKKAAREWRQSGASATARHAALQSRERMLWHRLPTAVTFAPSFAVGLVTEPDVPAFSCGANGAPVDQFRFVVARGFDESVTCTAADWVANADAILREHPVTRVRLTTAPTARWVGPKWDADGYFVLEHDPTKREITSTEYQAASDEWFENQDGDYEDAQAHSLILLQCRFGPNISFELPAG